MSLEVDVHDISGAKTGTIELPAELFGVTANIPLIHQVVVAQLAAARQGTHATKGRGEVRGGGAKPYRQKGTGRARQGSRRAPQWVGGGTVHGPHPHGYAQRTPKKMIAAALRGALSDRAREGRLHVISDLVSGDMPSTKNALAALRNVATSDKVLVVLHRDDDLAWLSLRNVAAVHALTVDQLNAYDVLVSDEVVFTSPALQAYVARSGASLAIEGGEELAEPIEPPLVATTEPPTGYDIKGNADSMKYHTPESPYYTRTVAEVWFDSVEAAEAAGFSNAQGDTGAESDEEPEGVTE
jgi:large subunit ribosomal protein L4